MAIETATLGGGCFWCTEAVYRDMRGVTAVQSGYAGGSTPNPTYEQVCTGRTGHAEVVQVAFDPGQVSYADILRVFFTIHDPTTPNRQGADVGTQYRSVIFTHSDAQARMARAVMDEIAGANIYSGKLVTQVEPAPAFHPAEVEHDAYYERNPNAGYCRAVVGPKVAEFRKMFADRVRSAAT
jgi:peptide-methionine (S)-S-oxide reductase